MTLNMKKVELGSSKNSKALEQAKAQVKEQQLLIYKLESENSSLQKRLQDIVMKLDEKDREVTDMKYQNEKDEFQLKLKEENVSQSREQLKKAEAMFKEEVERLRKEFFDQITKDYDNHKQGKQSA